MRLLRPRFTILTLMVVVAISAIVMSWFRPISRAEAEKIAEARFLKIPGASRWIGRYRVHASPGFSERVNGGWKRYADAWTVVFCGPEGRISARSILPDTERQVTRGRFRPWQVLRSLRRCPRWQRGSSHVLAGARRR